MVPDEEYPNATIIDFPKLFAELNAELGSVRRVGLVGAGRMPAECYKQIVDGFTGVELVDITSDYVQLRYDKSEWEREQIRAAFALADFAYDAMKAEVKPGVSEIQVAAAGEYAVRSRGASGFGFSAIVGSGVRSNAVVPTASSKRLQAGELVMIGIAPKVSRLCRRGGRCPAGRRPLLASGSRSACKHLKEAFRLTKAQLRPGKIGKEIDAPARAYFAQARPLEVSGVPLRPYDRPARGRISLLRPAQPRRAQAGHDGLH